MKRYFNGTILFLAALFIFGTVAQAGVISITHPSYGAIGNGSYDNTAAIQNALAAAAANDTVHIPAGIYNVSDTLVVPSGVRVQGVGSLFNCQIRLMTTNRPLFRVADGSSGVIFKDVTLSTNAADNDAGTIRGAGTTGIALLATNGISGTVIENVRVWKFTHGIAATSAIPGYDAPVPNVKIRNYASETNEYALYTNTRGADLWDVQNMNVFPVYNNQNGIFLELSGRMSFLQLSCAGSGGGICAKLWGNGDTYFRSMHVEGMNLGICTGSNCDGSTFNAGGNASVLTVENSATSGIFERATNLVSINNRFWLDQGGAQHYVFNGAGQQSWVASCGDVWVSIASNQYNTTVTAPPGSYNGLATGVHGCVQNYVASVPAFAKGYTRDNEVLSGALDVTAFGADGSDANPDTTAFTNALNAANGGSNPVKYIYIPAGIYYIGATLDLTGGESFVGAVDGNGEPLTTLVYTGVHSLFRAEAKPNPVRGITWRNLNLTGNWSNSAPQPDPGAVGIDLTNYSYTAAGAATDFQIQNVNFSSFAIGIFVHPLAATGTVENANPMFDSVSVKKAGFNNNRVAIQIDSQNASNWNLEDIDVITPNGEDGIVLNGVGLASIRGLHCSSYGTGGACLKTLLHAGLSIEGISSENVDYALFAEWRTGYTQYPITLRNNDLRAGVYFQGRVYLNSVNNTYPANLSGGSGLNVVRFAGLQEGTSQNHFYGGQSDVFSCQDKFKDPNITNPVDYWVYTGTLLKNITYCY